MDKITISTLLGVTNAISSDKPLIMVVKELPPSLKAGMILTLSEIPLLKEGDLFKINLQTTSGELISLEAKLPNSQKADTFIQNWQNLNVKVTPEGNLQFRPQTLISDNVRSQVLPTSENGATKNNIIATENVNKATKIEITPIKEEMQPIKVSEVVNKIMADLDLPISLKQDIAEIVAKTEIITVLKDIGVFQEQIDTLLTPLKNTLFQMQYVSDKPTEIMRLQQQLVQNIKELQGQTFEGYSDEFVPSSQKLILNSPLGKIWTKTPIKALKNQIFKLEVVDVRIEPYKELLPLIKVFSDKLSKIWPPEMSFPYKSEVLQQLFDTKDKKNPELLNIIKPLMELSQSPNLVIAIIKKIPGLKPDILENIYSFYKTANNSEIREWLGEKIYSELLTTKQGTEAIKQIEQLFVNSLKENPVWRMVEIPFFDGVQLYSWKIYVQKDKPDSQKNKRTSQGKRFVLDTEFSKLGAFQFDGYASIKEHRFDLVIRTSKVHSDDFCSHIMNLFKKSLYDVNYSGTIKINQRENFIRPFNEELILQDGVYI